MFDSVIASGRYSLNATYHENFNADFRNSPESILEVQQSVDDGAWGENGNFGDVLNYPHWSTAPVGCCGFHQPSQNLVNAFLLVPVQLTMMSRLHKIFGQSWSESLGKSLTKELVVVSLGKSAVGNILKVIPVVGTVTGGMVNASVAVAITEALGWVTVKMLNDGVEVIT